MAITENFDDPNYDLHVFSEMTGEYTRECFSPRSRSAADWSHDPCAPDFAHARCQEISSWLRHAAEAGVSVSHWVVLDDDDLLQTDIAAGAGAKIYTKDASSLVQRSSPGMGSKPVQLSEEAMPAMSPPAPALPKVAPAQLPDDQDNDDPWALAF